jgi:RNA polymerase sigma-70 factor, ECF subfamily
VERLQYARIVGDARSATGASDAELASRLAAGDRDAEAELYRRLAPRVRLYGLRHLRDPAAADDLVQDVILMTFDGLREAKVREPSALASFVLGTCRKVVANIRRGAQRRHQLLERHGRELPVATEEAAPLLGLDRLAQCLTALSERERSVVALSFYAERSADQIGVELGVSSGNVRVVRHRALARLRDCMKGDA